MIALDPIRPYLTAAKWIGVAALLVAVWGHGCSHGQKGLKEAKDKHAATLDRIATATAEQADRAKEVARLFQLARREAESAYQKGVEDAYERGAATAADIASGKLPVGGVWRDQCPQALPGEGSGPVRGDSGVSADRAQAIGNLLSLAGVADANDALLRARLAEAQKLLNACYEKPASTSLPR